MPIETLPIDKIKPSPANERRELGDIEGLAQSIRELGILQHPVVHLDGKGGYEIEAGHRRLAAAKLAGLDHVDCDVRDAGTAAEQRLRRMTENLQREDLTPIEEAKGYKALLDGGLTQSAIAEKLGIKQPHISKRLALLKLPRKLHRLIDSGDLTLAEAAQFVKVADINGGVDAALKTVKDWGWSVEQAVGRVLAAHQVNTERGLAITAAAEAGTKVVDRPANSGGKTRWVGGWDGIAIKGKHENFDCHAVAFERDDNSTLRGVCLDPSKHPEATHGRGSANGGAATLSDEQKAKRAAERLRKKELRIAAAGRVTFIQKALRAKPKAADVAALAAVQLVFCQPSLLTSAAMELMAVDKRFDEFCAESPDNATRGLLALCLAAGEHTLKSFYFRSRETPAHYEWLVAHGYEPTDAEKAELDKIGKPR